MSQHVGPNPYSYYRPFTCTSLSPLHLLLLLVLADGVRKSCSHHPGQSLTSGQASIPWQVRWLLCSRGRIWFIPLTSAEGCSTMAKFPFVYQLPWICKSSVHTAFPAFTAAPRPTKLPLLYPAAVHRAENGPSVNHRLTDSVVVPPTK